jgi:hypothetical protein
MEKVFDLKKGKGSLHNRPNDKTSSQRDKRNPAEPCTHNIANIIPSDTQSLYVKGVELAVRKILSLRRVKLQCKSCQILTHKRRIR